MTERVNQKTPVIYHSSDNKGNILVSVASFFFVWYGCVRSLAAVALGSCLASCSIVQILWLWPSGSVAVCGVSCSEACEILVPGPGIEPWTTRQVYFFFFFFNDFKTWMGKYVCCSLLPFDTHFIFLKNLVGTL